MACATVAAFPLEAALAMAWATPLPVRRQLQMLWATAWEEATACPPVDVATAWA